jgi:hypothetical protein
MSQNKIVDLSPFHNHFYMSNIDVINVTNKGTFISFHLPYVSYVSDKLVTSDNLLYLEPSSGIIYKVPPSLTQRNPVDHFNVSNSKPLSSFNPDDPNILTWKAHNKKLISKTNYYNSVPYCYLRSKTNNSASFCLIC